MKSKFQIGDRVMFRKQPREVIGLRLQVFYEGVVQHGVKGALIAAHVETIYLVGPRGADPDAATADWRTESQLTAAARTKK